MNKMKLEAQQKKICIYNYELKHSFSISKLKKNKIQIESKTFKILVLQCSN